ncbi:MAG: sulfatase, partial [Bacteroidota bacterium]
MSIINKYQSCFIWLLLFIYPTFLKSQKVDPPNIILIVVDDLGWKDVGFMGSNYYETPNLDRLAQQSVVFDNAYAAAANCAPSRACMMTGLNTPRHGIYTVSPSDRGDARTRKLVAIKNTRDLADGFTTIGEVLKSEDYTTATMGKWHLGPDPGSQGFDLNIGGNRRGHPKSYFSPYQNPNLEDGPEGEYLTDRLTSEAIGFIKENRKNPFFLYLPYFTIHTPLQGTQRLVEKYKNKGMLDGQGRNPNYGAMVERMDQNVGKVIKTIRDLDLQNTILIFTSDNGGIAYLSRQYPLRAGKGSYYEGGIRVPLLFHHFAEKWEPKTISAPVSNLDFMPTMLDLVDAEPLEVDALDGRSLLPRIEGKGKLRRHPLYWHFPIYLQAYRKGEDGSRDALFRTRPGSVIRYGDWKLHEYFEDGGLELYNLKKDPGESNNLAEVKKGKAKK